MSCLQIWNIEQEEKRKRESRRQARKLNEKKKQRRHFFDKTRNASGHQQCKVKMSTSEKKVNENTYDISSKKRVTGKILEVSHCSRAKQWQRIYRKSVLHVQRCFFAN